METLISYLTAIPAAIGFILALIGVIPFVMALKNPPSNTRQAAFYCSVYVAGAVGMMSFLAHLFANVQT
ncbi:hypothetical protein [Marinobacter lutaoensis]|uniref:hypothetical protein n=1 Tax=Marinobacter lutaoensis TaxID=135739 RepID=UPI0011156A5D|nr:hypothetical protein [Marinobacter lutaoensis]